ncbi:peptidyl-tRNA hydrolase isoform X2 [Cynoglossus semilaevis]|uniref:peptidyl-tRNA hydrolase isoform X2 n=1 Tax=Cynoglossus semilaevis TaxID=244447 RepID=UPI0007DC8926|nr:probable peptidyl-tRNA hydrolase isoform X2 [Cynoglossus semilaevis]
MKPKALYQPLLSLFRCLKKLLDVAAMRRLLNRVINRVLLSNLFKPTMEIGAEIHAHNRRKLVVGLGNPGMDGTRHNVGAAVLGALAARLSAADRWRGNRHVSGEVITLDVQDTGVVLLRPRLMMNINGVSVAKAAEKYGVRAEDVLLVHDDLDKPLGKMVIKHGGSARGHNGVRSCVDCLHTDVMPRLRVDLILSLLSPLESPKNSQPGQSSFPPAGGKRAAQSSHKDKPLDCVTAAQS